MDFLDPIFSLLGPSFAPLFMRRALVGLVLLASSCSLLGVQAVNARMAFFSDAVSHGAFAGLAVGWFLAVNESLSLALFSLAFGFAIIWLSRNGRLSRDTSIAVVFSIVVAGGLAALSQSPQAARKIQAYVMGSVLTLNGGDLVEAALLAVAAIAFFAFFGNRLALDGVNQELAKAHGVATAFYEYAFAALLALAAAMAARMVGVLLVTALLVLPAASARNLAASWGGMCRWSFALALAGSGIGLWLSARPWAGKTPVGAMIVLAMAAIFLATLPFSRRRPS